MLSVKAGDYLWMVEFRFEVPYPETRESKCKACLSTFCGLLFLMFDIANAAKCIV